MATFSASAVTHAPAPLPAQSKTPLASLLGRKVFIVKIKPQIAVVVTITVFVLGITITSVLGLWKTESTKIPAKYKEQQYSGQYNPADIRGSYTFSEISRLYNIPPEDLFAAFGVDAAKTPDFKCKDLESISKAEALMETSPM